MKKFYGILAVITLIAMLMGCIAVSAQESVSDNEEITAAPVNEGYQKAAQALERFGIYGEEYDLNAKITRGDFTAKAMCLTGAANTFKPADTEFTDVKADNINSGAVAAARGMGLVEGYGDGEFKPGNTLTKEQAVKVLVSLLGYKVYADSYGGYPGGYLTSASMQGLLKNVIVGDYAECTWGDAAQLIYNAMNTDVLQTETYPAQRYFTNDGENPMTLWMGISKIDATVLANDISAVADEKKTTEGYVRIGTDIFLENKTGTSKLLGYPVKAYWKTDDTGRKVLLSVSSNRNVKETYVSADEIEPATSPDKLYWYDEDAGRQQNMSIASSPFVIYNGKRLETALTAQDLMISEGSIRLVDTDSNGTAELVYIDEAEIYIADEVPKNGRIRDLYGKDTIALNIKDADLKLEATKYGEDIALDKIKKKSVLKITKSADLKLVTIEVCDERIKGSASEISNDSIVIGGTKYKLVKSNAAEIQKINLGTKATFYMTEDGRVAGFDTSISSGGNYGYLVIGSIERSGIAKDAKASVRIFETDGKVKQYNLSGEITLNGNRRDSSGEKYTPGSVLRAIKVHESTSSPKDKTETVFCNQLIKYSLDGEGNVSNIDTAIDNRHEVDKNNGIDVYHGNGGYHEDFSFDYSYRYDRWKCIYKQFGFIEGEYSNIGSITFSMPLPENKGPCVATNSLNYVSPWQELYNGTGSLDELESQLKIVDAPKAWTNDYDLFYTDIYDVKEDKTASVIIEYKAVATAEYPELDFFAVDKQVTGIGKDETVSTLVYGCYKGEYKAFTLADKIKVNDEEISSQNLRLEQGDVLRVAVTPTGEIQAVFKIFTMEKQRALKENYLLNGEEFNTKASGDTKTWAGYYRPGNDDANLHQIHNAMHVRFDKIIGDQLNVSLGYREGQDESAEKIVLLTDTQRTRYYVYDVANKKVYLGSKANIEPGNPNQTVVVRDRYFENYEAIIINRDKTPEIYWNGSYSW